MTSSERFDQVLKAPVGWALGRLALSYLTSETRIRYIERLNTPSSQDPVAFGDLAKPDHQNFLELFTREVGESEIGWAPGDLPAALKLLSGQCPSLTHWIDVLCRSYRITIEFHDLAPVVGADAVERWLKLTDWFDPDVLVCFLLAKQKRAGEVSTLTNWGLIVRLFDRQVEATIAQGVSDLHIHWGGFRTVNLLWLRVVSGRLQLQQVRRYEPRAVADADPDERVQRRLELEAERIHHICDQLSTPRSHLGLRWYGRPADSLQTACEDEATIPDQRPEDLVLRERAMLAQCFHDLLAVDWQRPSAKDLALEHALDRYLFAKNRFVRDHRQPTDTAPGLAAFRSYFHGTKSPQRYGAVGAKARDEVSLSLRVKDQEEVGLYLKQSPHLKRVELRVAPMPTPRAYHLFLDAWSAVEKQFGLRERGMDVRFAVHLKRSLESHTRELHDERTPTRRFLADMDRDTAVLHAYRTDAVWAQHAWRIVRVDLAGNERDAPPDLAAYCMNLVRGDPEALAQLDEMRVDFDSHRFWLNQKALLREQAAINLPKLGITCHAGEDFAQPLEGLYAIASAVDLMKLREGDSIGHGLAMGWDIARFNAEHAAHRLTQRGMQFDSLLWLHFELSKRHDLREAAGAQQLESWLLYEFNNIYGPKFRIASLHDLEELFSERAKPVHSFDARRNLRYAKDKARRMEVWDAKCVELRAQRAPIEPLVTQLTPAIEGMQRALLKDIAAKGIVVEFNPSSNLRISAANRLRDVPFVKMIRELGPDLLATINTDNPGSFGTRIENEYVILFHALRENNFSRGEATAVLETMRKVGRHNVFWASAPDDTKGATERNDEGDENERREHGTGQERTTHRD